MDVVLSEKSKDLFSNFDVKVYPAGAINVVNLVCTYNLGKEIDTDELVANCPFTCVKMFLSVKIKISYPRVTLNIFNTGSVIVIGSSNQYVSRDAAYIFTDIIRKALRDPDIQIHNFSYHNYTATCMLPFEVDLGRLNSDGKVFKSPYFTTSGVSKLDESKKDCGVSRRHFRMAGCKSEEDCENSYLLYRDFVKRFRVDDGEVLSSSVEDESEIVDFGAFLSLVNKV